MGVTGPARSTVARVQAIARRHHGILTLRSARQAGIPAATVRTLAHREELVHASHGVYRLPDCPPVALTRLTALYEWPGCDRKVLVGEIAAWLLVDCTGPDDESWEYDVGYVDLAVPNGFRTHRLVPDDLMLLRYPPAKADTWRCRGLRVSSPIETLRWCAAAAAPSDARSAEMLETWVTAFRDRHFITAADAADVRRRYRQRRAQDLRLCRAA